MLGTIRTSYRSYGSNYKKERGYKNDKNTNQKTTKKTWIFIPRQHNKRRKPQTFEHNPKRFSPTSQTSLLQQLERRF